MNDPPYPPLFAPKPGLTKEEQRKVKAFIKAGKMTICPPMRSEGMEELGRKRALDMVKNLTHAVKRKLGMLPRKYRDLSDDQAGEKRRNHERYLKRKEKRDGKPDSPHL